MRIGIDIDGVLADFTGHWPEVYQAWFGKAVTRQQVESWSGIAEPFGDEEGFWRWVDAVPNFWVDMPLLQGAAGALYDLIMAGHQVELITNRHMKAAGQTDQWCKRNLPNFGRLWTVHMVKGDKSVVPCQLYIDDNPRRIRELRKKQLRTIRFMQPWNAEMNKDGDDSPLWAAGSWTDVLKIITRESGQIPGQASVFEAGTIKVGAA